MLMSVSQREVRTMQKIDTIEMTNRGARPAPSAPLLPSTATRGNTMKRWSSNAVGMASAQGRSTSQGGREARARAWVRGARTVRLCVLVLHVERVLHGERVQAVLDAEHLLRLAPAGRDDGSRVTRDSKLHLPSLDSTLARLVCG